MRELFLVFENKPHFVEQPKSKSQAGWDQECELARWYQFPGWYDGNETYQAEIEIIDLFYRLFSWKNSISSMAVSSVLELISSGQLTVLISTRLTFTFGLLHKMRFILKN